MRVRVGASIPLLLALARPVHLRVTLATAVLGRNRRRNERGIDHCPALEEQAPGRKCGVDGSLNLQAQFVGFEQVAKAQDGALVAQVVLAGIQTYELAELNVCFTSGQQCGGYADLALFLSYSDHP